MAGFLSLESKYIEAFDVPEEITKFAIADSVTAEYIKVSDLHELYVESYGNPDGVPVITLHGGPGFGSSPVMAQYFDLDHYRVIVFDQRGAKRSKPFAGLNNNTSQALASDMEVIREHFGIDKWLVFGGSWGSTLSLLYGETYPDRCLGFVLRGVFLGSDEEVDNLLYGMRGTYPELWDEMIEQIPEDERGDLRKAAYSRLTGDDTDKALSLGIAFMRYDVGGATLAPDFKMINSILKDDKVSLGVPKIFFHFAVNHFFLEKDQIVNNLHKITHLPCYIVHGRHDAITKVERGYTLHKIWPGSKLYIAERSGHISSEPEIEKGLTAATEEFKNLIN